jgi:uncharacterized protein
VIDLIKILAVFFVLMLLTFKKVSLWINLLLTTVLLGLLFRMPVSRIALDLLSAARDRDTLLLLGALVAILFFSNLLKETGRIDRILDGFGHLIRDERVLVVLLPAMIGLMPVVGGALLSAPMVVPGCDRLGLSRERRTFLNYWFRHVWEFVLPTYPALLVAATLMGISVRRLCWIMIPFTPLAIVSGILIGYWGIKRVEGKRQTSARTSGQELFKNLFPLLFGLILVVGFKVELAYAFGITILGMIVFYRIGKDKVIRGFRESLGFDLLLAVTLVMGFKKVLESSQAIHGVSATLSSSGVPNWVIAMLIPLLIGVMTGFTVTPIAIGFPILIPLFRGDPNFHYYMGAGFVSGIAGVMLSPFHPCLVLTREFFQADWKGVYRLVCIPVASLLAVALLMIALTGKG